MKHVWSRDDLVNLAADHDVLVAVDSDGCVFDSMRVKQGVFHSGLIEFWGLEAAADEARRLCEWVGLYSPWRGLNRFQLILKIFRCLEEYLPNIGKSFPTKALAAFVESGKTLSMPELETWIEKTGEMELQRVLDWSREMSRRIAELPPAAVFDGVFQGLEKLHAAADLIVVSQTTEDALIREWNHAGLSGFADVIAGAELGSKAESLKTAMSGRYGPEQALMVGDATGDLEAARAAECLFFPILPGDEVNSWKVLCNEGMERLRSGTFSGVYQNELIARFNSILTETPPDAG
jgi:phosphoglycolate phosphatase-like HAD superfamily hydrolase